MFFMKKRKGELLCKLTPTIGVELWKICHLESVTVEIEMSERIKKSVPEGIKKYDYKLCV